jgi:hypothetical protein
MVSGDDETTPTREPAVLRHLFAWVVIPFVVLIAAISPGAPVPDADAARLMNALTDGRPGQPDPARRLILARRDARFVAVLIELLRAGEIGLLPASVWRRSRRLPPKTRVYSAGRSSSHQVIR